MAIHRLFLIWTHTLFREVIHRSSAHPDFIWVGNTNDFQVAVDEIVSACPDTVVIEDVGDNHSLDIMKILKACSPDIQVIVMNLSNNKLDLFQHREQYVVNPDDLVNCILREKP